MTIWCTRLVLENRGVVLPLYTIEENVKLSKQPFCDHCRCSASSIRSHEEESLQEFIDENVEPLADKMDNIIVSDGADTSFTGLKKKKEKKRPVDPNVFNDDAVEEEEENDGYIGEDGDESDELQLPRYPWEGNDRNYLYDEIKISIAFTLFADQNADIAVVEAGLGGARDATSIIALCELAAGTPGCSWGFIGKYCISKVWDYQT